MLDREYAYLVAALHQAATLRHLELGLEKDAPDLLSSFLQVVESSPRDGTVAMRMEPDVAEALWPTVSTWGFEMPEPGVFQTGVREDRAADFLTGEGMPRLPARPKARGGNQLSIKDLVQLQLNNDAFICGLLDNARVSNLPGLVAMIVLETRSLRVLDKIISVRRLHTGPANKDVPRLLLLSPARIPLNSLKPFIHVRYVSRVDLERLARPRSEVRPEVQKEVATYLAMLKKG